MIVQGGIIHRDRIALAYTAVVSDTPQLVLIVVHGLSEHKGRYLRLQHDLAGAAPLADGGYAVYAYDQRGFGKSGGPRTHVNRYTDYLLDLRAVIAFVRGLHPEAKIVIMGHSLGGLVAATFCATYPNGVHGLVLSAPAYEVPPLPVPLRLLAFLLQFLMPNLPAKYPNDPEQLSHDPEVVAAFRNDPLVQSAATPRFYAEFLKMNRYLHKNADRICLPTLLLQGGKDQIVIPQGAKALLHKIQSAQKEIFWYDGFLHEPFNEMGRERVISDLIGWLKATFI